MKKERETLDFMHEPVFMYVLLFMFIMVFVFSKTGPISTEQIIKYINNVKNVISTEYVLEYQPDSEEMRYEAK